MNTRSPSTAASRRRAFTLLEVLIVVGVILILASLVVAVSTALLKRAEKTQTESAMNIVESAMNEYEAIMGRPLTYDGTRTPGQTTPTDLADIWEPANPTGVPAPNGTTIGRARAQGVYAMNLLPQIDSVRPIIAGIPQDLLRPDKTRPIPRQILRTRPR